MDNEVPKRMAGDPETSGSLTGARDRVHAVIEAAERAAAAIREDAETRARRHLDESKAEAEALTRERLRLVSELTGSLVEEAETLRRMLDQTITEFARTARRLETVLGVSGAAESDTDTGGRVTSAPRWPERGAGGNAGNEGSSGWTERKSSRMEHDSRWREGNSSGMDVSQDARIAAVQMAVAGSERDEIERRLRDEFGIEDASVILEGLPDVDN